MDDYKSKIAALDGLANLSNKNVLDKIKKLIEQQKAITNLYGQHTSILKPKFFNILKTEDNSNFEETLKRLKKLTDDVQKNIEETDITSKVLEKKTPNVGENKIIRNSLDAPFSSEGFQHEKDNIEEFRLAAIDQSKHLHSIKEQNVIITEGISQLLEQILKFETAKAVASNSQSIIFIRTFWATVIAAFISFGSLVYGVFVQRPPQVTVHPSAINVSIPPSSFDPLIKSLREQTKELKKKDAQ